MRSLRRPRAAFVRVLLCLATSYLRPSLNIERGINEKLRSVNDALQLVLHKDRHHFAETNIHIIRLTDTLTCGKMSNSESKSDAVSTVDQAFFGELENK